MWNFHVCECQCLSPYSPDATGACYQGGTAITNAFSGCTLDCPWFVDVLKGTCVKHNDVPPGITKIYLSKGRCCRNELKSASASCISTELTFLTSAFASYWYPDWEGGTTTCKNNGAQPMYMNMNPATYLHLSPLTCCSAYFGWAYNDCTTAALSSIQRWAADATFTSGHSLKYEGSFTLDPTTCAAINGPAVEVDTAAMVMANATFAELCKDFCKPGDKIEVASVCGSIPTTTTILYETARSGRNLQAADNTLRYILTVTTPTADDASILLRILNSQLSLESTRAAIQQHMKTWGLDATVIIGFTFLDFFVMQGNTIIRSKVYYPDWGNKETCVADGNEPSYMKDNPDAWVFTTLKACCARYYGWNQANCEASGASGTGVTGNNATMLWFPDWATSQSIKCIQNDNTTAAPDYMANNPTGWMKTTVTGCCERYFNWDLNKCLPNSGVVNATAGSGEWYVNWVTYQCVKDCLSSGSDANCGGLKQQWDSSYTTAGACCTGKLAWKDKNTCTPTGPP